MAGAVLAIDQGTTNTKALLIAANGEVLSSGSSPLPVRYPKPGWAETDGAEVLRSTREAVAACLKDQSIFPAAIGISNQRETVLLWDRETAEPIGPCVIWQCRRSADRIAKLRNPETERLVADITGLGMDPLFPAAKIGWLLDEIPGAREKARDGRLCAGTVDSWLLFNLTGGASFATDFSNASRTQLFDIRNGAWSKELCELHDVPPTILPPPKASDSAFGRTVGDGAFPEGIPITGMMGDSHAALFGHGAREPGTVKATYGTGSSLMTLTDRAVASEAGLSSTIAWRRGDTTFFALEGNITVSGHAAAWASGILGLDGAGALTTMAAEVGTSDGVYFVPALAGLGAPHWDTDARGIFTGLSLATTQAHMAYATLEAIAFQVADVFNAMERDTGRAIGTLMVDGGPTNNALLMQIQSDIIGREVVPARLTGLSAFGAAVMAGTSAGVWDDDAFRGHAANRETVYRPDMPDDDRVDRLKGWHRAVRLASASQKND